MNSIFDFVDKEKFNDIFKDKSVMEPLAQEKTCTHPAHNPPLNLFVPYDQQYRHVCPACGHTIFIGGNGLTF